MTDAWEWESDGRFRTAVDRVLEHEGGFVDHPKDPGGATNWGVSLRFLRGLQDADGDGWLDGDLDHDGDVDADDIRQMTADQAREIYWRQWWHRYDYGRFDLPVAVKLFDLAVNMGHGQAAKLLQRSVRATEGIVLADDGVIGPHTVQAVVGCPAAALRIAMRSEAAGFYRGLVAAKRDRGVFLAGWLNRAYW